jgi:L-seryl-tRNA(Ser) seleniumtransferase
VDLSHLAAAKSADACVIDVAPWPGLHDPRDYGFESIPTLNERLDAGADLVVADGAGLLGGPTCGLVIGSRRAVESVARHSLAKLVAPATHVVAALEAVLSVHRSHDGGVDAIFQLPVWQLLTAPLANLEQRAQRLAALMAEDPGVARAAAVEVESPWRCWGGRQWSAKSWCIDVQCANEAAGSLQKRLARGANPVLAQVADQCIRFNLRSVFPRWDQRLVAALEARGGSEPAEAAGP